MNKEHALQDLYAHESDVRLLLKLSIALLIAGGIALAIDAYSLSFWFIVGGYAVLSMSHGTMKGGYSRRFWSYFPNSMDGVPLNTKREALEQYRITDKSDLEDIK